MTGPATGSRPTAGPGPDPGWVLAEERIGRWLDGLDRWEAERLAASQERRIPRMTGRAVRAAVMRAAIDRGKDDVLDQAAGRLASRCAAAPWASVRHDDPALAGALAETVDAVAELAWHALAATVLADESRSGLLIGNRADQLRDAAALISDSNH